MNDATPRSLTEKDVQIKRAKAESADARTENAVLRGERARWRNAVATLRAKLREVEEASVHRADASSNNHRLNAPIRLGAMEKRTLDSLKVSSSVLNDMIFHKPEQLTCILPPDNLNDERTTSESLAHLVRYIAHAPR